MLGAPCSPTCLQTIRDKLSPERLSFQASRQAFPKVCAGRGPAWTGTRSSRCHGRRCTCRLARSADSTTLCADVAKAQGPLSVPTRSLSPLSGPRVQSGPGTLVRNPHGTVGWRAQFHVPHAADEGGLKLDLWNYLLLLQPRFSKFYSRWVKFS